jgi:hypothetical protein
VKVSASEIRGLKAEESVCESLVGVAVSHEKHGNGVVMRVKPISEENWGIVIRFGSEEKLFKFFGDKLEILWIYRNLAIGL